MLLFSIIKKGARVTKKLTLRLIRLSNNQIGQHFVQHIKNSLRYIEVEILLIF